MAKRELVAPLTWILGGCGTMMGVVVHVWAFVGIAALVIITPGPDTALVT